MKKIFIFFLITAFILSCCGCSNMITVTKEDFLNDKVVKDDIEVITTKDEVYKFKYGDYELGKDSLRGKGYKIWYETTIDFKGSLANEDIKELRNKKFNLGMTILVVGLAALIVVPIILGELFDVSPAMGG